MNPDKESAETEDQVLLDEPLAAAPPEPDEESMNPEIIRSWANENIERAKVLGVRLIQAQTPADLEDLESLGEFEDRATEWAIKNPFKAKLLILTLVAELR